MTGMYPARLHVTDFIPGHPRPHANLKVPDWTMRLEHRYVTLAEALRAGGYATAHVGKWHLAPRDPEKRFIEDEDFFPRRQGFDVEVAGTCYPGTYYYPYRKRGYDARVAEGAEPSRASTSPIGLPTKRSESSKQTATAPSSSTSPTSTSTRPWKERRSTSIATAAA